MSRAAAFASHSCRGVRLGGFFRSCCAGKRSAKIFGKNAVCPGARIVDAKNPAVALLILEMATSRWNCWLSQARRSRRYSTNTLTLAARPAASITVSVE
jgi:hypothetical protein